MPSLTNNYSLSLFKKKKFIYLFGMQDLLIAVCEILIAAYGIQLPDQGSSSGPLHGVCRVLDTGLPGKSLSSYQQLLVEFKCFPRGSDSKESACNAGDLGSTPGLGRAPGGRHDNPLFNSCLENPHGQRSLVGYSPSGCKESDMTEQLSTVEFKQLARWPYMSCTLS